MRLIDADAFKEEIMKSLKACEEWQNDCSALLNTTDYYRAKQGVQTFQMCIAFLEKQPTIEERKKGEWIKTIKHYKDDNMEFDFYDIKCSACGEKPEKAYHLTRYCPNCGADLRGEDDAEIH